MKQEKTLALDWALHAHAKESGFLTGVLCKVAWELQKCMALLMALSGDEIVEASLIRPTGEEHRTFPTPEEEATLLDEVELSKVPEQLEVYEPEHLTK